MAKKKEMSANDVFAEMDQFDAFGSADLLNTDIAKITEYIDMGNWILNAAVSGSIKKGWANNKILQLAGEPGAGKTFIAVMMCRMAQKLGYSVAYIDTEGAIDQEMLVNFGIDLGVDENGIKKFRYTPISEAGDLTNMMTKVVNSMKEIVKNKGKAPKVLFVVDSIGMIASDKEVNDAMEGKKTSDMGTRAKSIRSLFRKITSNLNVVGNPMIYTNHVGVNIGGYGDATIISGGDGANYSASCTLCLSKAKLKDDSADKTKQTGVIVTAKTHKSRFSQPKVIKFPIRFDRPFNRYAGVQDYLSWENVGMERGNILTPKEVNKLSASDKEKVIEFTPNNSDEVMYFMPKATARNFVIEHLGEAVPLKELFTARVMDPEIDRFDDLIRKDFEFQSQDVEDEISQILEDEVND